MATSRLPALPATAHGPAAVAVAVAAASVVIGVAASNASEQWAALLFIGVPFGMLWGLFHGLVTLPAFLLTGFGYGPPELTPATAVGRVRDAWRFHVGGALFYSLVSSSFGVYVTFTALLVRIRGGSPPFLGAAGGTFVGACFVLAQVWRTRSSGESVSRRAIVTWIVLGVLLALPPLLAGSYQVFWGVGDEP